MEIQKDDVSSIDTESKLCLLYVDFFQRPNVQVMTVFVISV
jgi:hypothetical protein